MADGITPNHVLFTEQYSRALLSGEPSTPSEVSYAYIDARLGATSSRSSEDERVILLIHGYPETAYQFRHVIPLLAKKGYRVIAPDYRGAGHSSKPRSGYTKSQIAADIHQLLTKHLGIKSKVNVVGHDIGGMIAHAYASRFPESTRCVAWGECPLPGTQVYEDFKFTPGVWHFQFQWQSDIPEALTEGREDIYIKHFYDRLSHRPGAITPSDRAYYTFCFKQPGAMRAGFDLYRAFHEDADENKKLVQDKGKCKVRCTTLNGAQSFLAGIAEKQAKEMYEAVEVRTVEQSGHWCAEENPHDFVKKVLEFIEKE